MKNVVIGRGESKEYSALDVLTRPLREDVAYDLAILGIKFISFEKDILLMQENKGVIASTRWIKNDVAHILAKLENINRTLTDEGYPRRPTEKVYNLLCEKFIAHCIADLHYEEYELKNS